MSRTATAIAILACVFATLAMPTLARARTPAVAAAAPVDQAGWTARKRMVRLPNGIALAYVEMGDPAGPPALLLHGYTDNSRAWSILAPYLLRHRLIIPDQRGHGASAAPPCCYAPSDFAEDARLLLDALGIERAAVVGHSLGSMVGQVLAAREPARVSRLVLIGGTALVPVRRGDWLWDEVAKLREPVSASAGFLAQWSPGASPTPVDRSFLRHYEPEIARVPLHVWRGVLRELVDLPVGRYAPEIAAPVAILSAGADPLFGPEHHQALLAAFPRAEAHVFPDLGHNFIMERPEEVGPVLARLLDAPAPEPALR